MLTPPISFSPAETYNQALERAAAWWGIECEYWDIWGSRHQATAEGMAAVLASAGVDTSTREALDAAVEARLWREWSQPLPPTLVISARTPALPVRVPEKHGSRPITLQIDYEDGTSDILSVELAGLTPRASARLRGLNFVEKLVELPQIHGRLGYHSLQLKECNGPTRLILCPDRAYFPQSVARNGRAAGISVSLYGLRSERNWGCGDFTDLQRLIEWTASELGASFIGLNPLHAIPNRQPYNTSPYLPACSFYRNFIYLDPETIPDFARSSWARRLAASPAMAARKAALRSAEFVEYEQVSRLKKRFLKLLFRTFLVEYRANSPRAQQFREYIRREGALLDDYAVYCALDEAVHKEHPEVWLWTEWPAPYRDPRSAETRAFAESHWRSVLFYKYIQWQIDVQLAAAQKHAKDLGLAIGLYHDLALATDRFGADLWAHRPYYVAGCRVGAPADDFSPNGQDWSFPPPNSQAHFEDGYRLFVESIRKNLHHGGALRIDHVMRFFHLFWIPDALDAKRGLYVRDRHEDLIRILALESVRNEVLVVGEDLGTVADEIRDTLRRFGILSYRLFYFEKGADGRFRLPHEYPQQAIVSASTHDLPTVAGFWENRDIEARRRVGMFSSDADRLRQIEERMADKQKMLDLLFVLGLMPKDESRSAANYPELTGELHNAIVGFLASTPATLMVLSEEDLMKQCDQQNLPGTCEQYPNWRHKTRFTLEQLPAPPARDFAAMYKGWLNVTARLNFRS